MNLLLWILQGIFALHTIMGAVWKFSNPAQAVPSLKAIPHGVWLTMGVLELLFSLGLIVPALHRPLAILAPLAAACIAAEMLFISGVHLYSRDRNHGLVAYWMVVACIGAFLAYGRFVLAPL